MGRLGLSLFGLERRDFEHRRQRSEADDRKRTRRRDRAMWKRIGVQSGVGVGGGRVWQYMTAGGVPMFIRPRGDRIRGEAGGRVSQGVGPRGTHQLEAGGEGGRRRADEAGRADEPISRADEEPSRVDEESCRRAEPNRRAEPSSEPWRSHATMSGARGEASTTAKKRASRNEKSGRRKRGSTIDRSRVGAEAAAVEGGAEAGVDAAVKRKSWTRGGGIELGARSRGGRKERSWSRDST